MIYLDNAATTWPKPESVYRALDEFARNAAANPGRSGHRMAVAAEAKVGEARARVANLLNAESPDRIVLTLNATDALNIAIKGILRPGDHVVTSVLEHNSINRPLAALEQAGAIAVTRLPAEPDGSLSVDALRGALTPATRLVAVTHGSNVLGVVNDAAALGDLAMRHGAVLLLDASQTAGVVPIDVRAQQLDLVAFPGHKGCLGPMGTGVLYVRAGLSLRPFREGGTGFAAESELQPEAMPFRLEGGTPNAHGLAGLAAGLEFLEREGVAKIGAHERDLALRFAEEARRIPGITVWSGRSPAKQIGPVSLSIQGREPGEVGAALDERYGIACRPGLHCAPGTHRFLGTFPKGTVRFSFGYFNTPADVAAAAGALREIATGN
ncbi:MAG TPA: aminotransferase class V-fold PLP-dependent enzyme [Planctomycetota bacterium]|nr:aminotransferase class V-fold PLP-dependent enzyme [Planctomycetota bacterium]